MIGTTYRLLSRSLIATAGLLLVFSCSAIFTRAQQETTTASAHNNPKSSSNHLTDDDNHYRIGPGDVLDVKVFNQPNFTREGVKVDPRGKIRMPLVKHEIMAACRTEEELEIEVTTQLKEYIREPQVSVQIKEYQSEPVAVLGAVRAPSRFQLQRKVRLLELLTFVNGPNDNAGRTVQVVHTGSRSLCGDAAPETAASQIDSYTLSETLNGQEKANPYVRAGDIISIAQADQVYVIGNVVHPATIALTEPLTVSQAIAMAGGAARDSKKSEIRIARVVPGTAAKKEILVDLEAINRHKAEDVELMANDIIDVPTSSGKVFIRSLMGAVVPNVASLPVRIVP
jgi:polysaccharide biosynthesis/export protein